MSFDDELASELRELEAAHRLRVPRVLDGAQGPVAVVDGVEVLNFASNDYLGLAGDARLVAASTSALEEDGVGAGASRLVVGNHRRHVELERSLADWLRAPAARLFSSGYAANVGVLTALLRAGDVVFSDALNHASIIDGCRLSRAQVVVFPHRDLAALATELGQPRGGRRLVVSESLFSMDGDVADVVELARMCRIHDAVLMLDEAHAVGVLGPEGRGVAAGAGVIPDVLVGTLGKALGSFGAFVAGSLALSEVLWNRARSFVFSTGMPQSVAAGSSAAIEIVRSLEGDARRERLRAHGQRLRTGVSSVGGAKGSPIAPLMFGDDRRAMAASQQLFEQRMFVQGIRPPTVPEGTARLRISLSAGHQIEHVSRLCNELSRLTE